MNITAMWFVLIFWTVFCLSIVIILICIFTKIAKDNIERERCKNYYFTTLNFIKRDLRYIINISAPIRGGKTSLMCALGHAFTTIIMASCQRTIQKFKQTFIELDYGEVDNLIRQMYIDGLIHNKIPRTSQVVAAVISLCPEGYFDGVYDDYIEEKPKVALLYNYVEDFMSLLDCDFTWSNVYFHNRITNKDSKRLEDSDFDIKDSYAQNKYVLARNKCYLLDEETLKRQSQNYHQLNKEDKGRDVCYRTFGQIELEKSYIITTAQVGSRIYILLRELYNCFVSVNKLRVVATMPFFNRCLDALEMAVAVGNAIGRAFHIGAQRKQNFDNGYNIFKVMIRVIEDIRNYYYSGSFLVWNCDICYKESNVGKLPDGERIKNFDFVFPIRYSFGTYDTHYFSFLHDELEKNSEISQYDRDRLSNYLDEEESKMMTKQILSKRDSSSEENEEVEY